MNPLALIGSVFNREKPSVRSAFNRNLFKNGQRAYSFGQVNRLTADFVTSISSADSELRNYIKIMRERARALERDNDYVRRFLQVLQNNVLGANGVKLMIKPLEDNGKTDDDARKQIIAAWNLWCRMENCCISKDMSFADVEKIVLRRLACDGEMFIRIWRGAAAGNKFGIALQPMEGDYVDHWYNSNQPNGNMVRMGIEMDAQRRVVAYWCFKRHPGDWLPDTYVEDGRRIRIDAEDMIHVFCRERVPQSRGASWLASSGMRLKMLDGYEDAEVVAARGGACKGGFFEKDFPEGYAGGEDQENDLTMEMEPGMFEELPMGVKFKPLDPTHPNSNFGDFIKSVLRGVAAGLGIGYNTLANDLERANYSSLRAGSLEEREFYMSTQSFLIGHLHQKLFPDWLKSAMLTDQVKLPMTKFDKFNVARWKARRWPWVDPEKDMNAAEKAINLRTKSLQGIIAEQSGEEFEDVQLEIKENRDYMAELGLIDTESMNGEMTAYGVAVRAGLVTPCMEDEDYFRGKYGFPPMSDSVKKAWDEQGGWRYPITLTQTQSTDDANSTTGKDGVQKKKNPKPQEPDIEQDPDEEAT